MRPACFGEMAFTTGDAFLSLFATKKVRFGTRELKISEETIKAETDCWSIPCIKLHIFPFLISALARNFDLVTLSTRLFERIECKAHWPSAGESSGSTEPGKKFFNNQATSKTLITNYFEHRGYNFYEGPTVPSRVRKIHLNTLLLPRSDYTSY